MRRLVGVLLIASGSLAAAATQAKPFTNVTEESGVAAVVKAHYQNVPKWWMSGIDLVDLDGDGHLDLHLGGHGFPAAAALNDGKGHFTYVDPKLAIPRGVRVKEDIPYPGGEIRLAFDFDEDGKLDILASWHDGGGVLYLNDCRSGNPPAWNFKRPGTFDEFNRSCAMADVDRDGIADYLADFGGRADPQILILFGKGDAPGGRGPGRADPPAKERLSGSFALPPKGKGAFERKQLIPDAYEEGGAFCVDINGDGHLDFLVSRRGYHPPGRKILLNDGVGAGPRARPPGYQGPSNLGRAQGPAPTRNATKECGLTEEGGSIHGVGDLNQDGALDLICIEGEKEPFKLLIYLNDGKGHFTPKPDAIAGAEKLHPHSANWGGAIVTDIDNDGIPDILINGRHFFYVLRGTGGGKFTVMNEAWGLSSGAWSAVDEGLCFGDIDGDGDLDIIACAETPTGKQHTVSVFRNDLPKQHWLNVRLVGKKGNRSAANARIRVYEAGGLGDPKRLLWFEEVAIWGRQSFHSYYAAAATERHFGLGPREAADLAIEFYPSGKRVERREAKADAAVTFTEE